MTEITIPDKLTWDEDLEIKFPTGATNLQAAIYESPRATYSEEDIQCKNTIWKGDVDEISQSEDIEKLTVSLKMRRGPDKHRAIYGKYLVKASCIKGEKSIQEEKII